MLKYIVKRFVQMIVVLFVVSILVFMLTNFIGDPVDMLVPENATVEQVESARARLGLNKPLPVQYGIFLRMCCTVISASPIPMENQPWA